MASRRNHTRPFGERNTTLPVPDGPTASSATANRLYQRLTQAQYPARNRIVAPPNPYSGSLHDEHGMLSFDNLCYLLYNEHFHDTEFIAVSTRQADDDFQYYLANGDELFAQTQGRLMISFLNEMRMAIERIQSISQVQTYLAQKLDPNFTNTATNGGLFPNADAAMMKLAGIAPIRCTMDIIASIHQSLWFIDRAQEHDNILRVEIEKDLLRHFHRELISAIHYNQSMHRCQLHLAQQVIGVSTAGTGVSGLNPVDH